jgi:Spy/CpxP family protein refolding chaperone
MTLRVAAIMAVAVSLVTITTVNAASADSAAVMWAEDGIWEVGELAYWQHSNFSGAIWGHR